MKTRSLIILLLLLGLFLLSYFSVHDHPWISVADCLENPEKYDGAIITSYHEPQIGEIYVDGFVLLQKHNPSIRVYANTTGLTKNEYVGLKAVFHKTGYLKAVDLIVARKRREKIWISVIPTLLVGVLLLRYFRLNWKPFQIELNKHA
jgi:hypothetical protein